MLKIEIPENEYFDEEKNEFIKIKEQTLCLEHSLVSISKWESKWHKPFLSNFGNLTGEETLSYVKFMTIQKVPSYVYLSLTDENIKEISEYINDPMTATTFSEVEGSSRGSREIVTSEIVYYWMITLQIPFECQKWHINRLLTLIRVCNEKNQPAKKMSKKAVANRNAALNAARRAKYGSKG